MFIQSFFKYYVHIIFSITVVSRVDVSFKDFHPQTDRRVLVAAASRERRCGCG